MLERMSDEHLAEHLRIVETHRRTWDVKSGDLLGPRNHDSRCGRCEPILALVAERAEVKRLTKWNTDYDATREALKAGCSTCAESRAKVKRLEAAVVELRAINVRPGISLDYVGKLEATLLKIADGQPGNNAVLAREALKR